MRQIQIVMPTAISCRLCELQQQHHRPGGNGLHCPAAAAGTPLSVLPGHRPNERRRERSRDVSLYNQFRRRPPDEVTTSSSSSANHRYHHVHQHHGQQENSASVLLATPSPSSSAASRDAGGRWRQRRRRSPSRRQRIHASLLRQFSPRRSSPPVAQPPPPLPTYSVDYSKCPLCQPRYSPSPDRLGLKPVTPRIIDTSSSVTSNATTTAQTTTTTNGAPRGRPPKPRDYQSAATSNNIDKKANIENNVPSRHNQRRSKSEYRQRKSPSRVPPSTTLYNIDLEVKRQKAERDLNSWTSLSIYRDEVNGNHGYSELKEPKTGSNRHSSDDKKRARSKSRSRYGQMANNGLLTVWPGKEGVWLPQ